MKVLTKNENAARIAALEAELKTLKKKPRETAQPECYSKPVAEPKPVAVTPKPVLDQLDRVKRHRDAQKAELRAGLRRFGGA